MHVEIYIYIYIYIYTSKHNYLWNETVHTNTKFKSDLCYKSSMFIIASNKRILKMKTWTQ